MSIMEKNPHLGIDSTWKRAPQVTLHIIEGRGVMVEKRTEKGLEPTITVEFITPSIEAAEQAVLDETRFT